MRLLTSRICLIAIMGLTLLGASSASALVIYDNDFSDYAGTFTLIQGLTFSQNLDTVELTSTANLGGTRTNERIALPTDADLLLTIDLPEITPSKGWITISFYDGFNRRVGTEDILTPLSQGINMAAFGAAAPVSTETFEIRIRANRDGVLLVNQLTVENLPEPNTFALMSLGGLLMLRLQRRS